MLPDREGNLCQKSRNANTSMHVNCGQHTGLSFGLAVIRFNDYVSGLEELYRIIILPVRLSLSH